MHDSRLLDLLKVLSKKEIQKLYDYVDSPFFAKSDDCVKLFTLVRPYLFKWDSPNWEKENVYTKVYPKTEYNNLKFNKLCFDALALVEKFYMHYHIDEDNLMNHNALLNLYMKERLPKHHESLLKSFKTKLEKQPLRNLEYLYQSFLIANKSTQYIRAFSQERVDKDLNYMWEYASSLDAYYLGKKLEISSLALNFRADTLPLASFYEQEIINFFKKQPTFLQTYPFLQMYYCAFLLLKQVEPEKQASHLSTLLMQHEGIANKDDFFNLFNYVQNFYIHKINTGQPEFEVDLLQSYKNQVRLGLLDDYKGNLNASIFKNIVLLALRLREVEWTKEFIENQSPFLPQEVRDDVSNYCWALYTFTEKQYSKTLKYLSNLEPVDIFFNLSVRRLQIQTYFEQEEWDLMQAAVNTFRVFIHREKDITDRHKESYRNFCNFTLKVADAIYEPKKLLAIKEEIEQTAVMTEKRWLLGRIESTLKLHIK